MSRGISAGPVRPVAVGDGVIATGLLLGRGGVDGEVRLGAVGRGLYGRFLGDAGDISVATDLRSELVSDSVVTIRGTWSGVSITDARVVDLVDPIEMPESLGERLAPDLVPGGRLTKAEVLAPAVLDLTRGLGHEKLLFYCAHELEDGWIGVACATNVAAVEEALTPLLGDALVVVDVDWSARDLEMIDQWVMGDDVAPDLLSFGRGMDSAGQYRWYVLLRMITPQTASVLARLHPDALLLTSWIQKS